MHRGGARAGTAIVGALTVLLTMHFLAPQASTVRAEAGAGRRRIAIEWAGGRPEGRLAVDRGRLIALEIARGTGAAAADGRFAAAADGPFRLLLDVEGSESAYGAAATSVRVATARDPFRFFLRDARARDPVWVPAYAVVVTGGEDTRSYAQIAEAIRARGLTSKLERIERAPEESFDAAAASTRALSCQTWLGLGRDMRTFGVGERLDWIQPRFHGEEVTLPESGDRPCRYQLLMGRGWGAVESITRRLEDGVLPILHGTLVDEDVTYQLTAFAAPETQPLTPATLQGTHFLVADGHALGHMFTEEQQARFDALAPAELAQPEETVLFLRIRALNSAAVPRYAFFKNLAPGEGCTRAYRLEGDTGFGVLDSGRVFAISRLGGRPLVQEEVAFELGASEHVDVEVLVPHRPLPRARALALAQASFEGRHEEVRRFWQGRLASAARIHVPEPRIDEMIRAGLLHLDLVTYGREPAGTLTPTIGVYSAIGSESAPIVQFMDSMGWHDVARRALTFFLDKQHDDGLMQNFGSYMLETGAVLWTIGEHFRYTRDDGWVRAITPKLLKAGVYLQRWRQRNLREELRGRGFGMLEGKAADPDDMFRSFMVNGYAYLGLARLGEVLEPIDPPEARRWRKEAEALRADIRTALFEAMGRSPLVPLADGTWSPTAPPWAEHDGPLMLFADGQRWFTHGSMTTRDSLLGPLYLVFQEVVSPTEPVASFLLEAHNDLMTVRNVALSQPYYSRHPVIHLDRGDVKCFLAAYYDTVASLADRQTYTFWEHYFGASPHKTHEEAWFLMDTRWMLYREHGAGITLLGGVPRAYLSDGKHIALERVATYFGPMSLRVDSRLDRGTIEATVTFHSEEHPAFVELRLPHPEGRRATWAKGGTYDAATERVRIEPFTGSAAVTLGFAR